MVRSGINVFARVKPEASRKQTVHYEIHRRPKKHSNEDFLVLNAPQKFAEYIDNRPESWNFSFHRIFEQDVSQTDVFENVARPVIDSVFDGYNATIFAYGQTGSGKTYTITGERGIHAERGILPRTLQYIFDIVRKNPENLYTVEVAYLEIYNENGYDLLLEGKERESATRLEDLPRVTIQEDESGTMHLKNLSFRNVRNDEEALQLLLDGDAYRAVSETPMNPRSSRSHCIFTIVITVKKFGADRCSRAKMHLVDLAGSERVYKCSIQGTILTEAKHINLSLHFLEQVIVCLGQDNVSHVPYRNSLLTSVLRDSLGGNCLTTMLATLSVSSFNLEETISTCRFAQRVALVKNDVNLTFDLDTRSENILLKLENERLRRQIEELKKQNIPESSGHKDVEYYKSLVVQRDQEISHLIDLLEKERSRRKSVVQEIPEASKKPPQDDKSTQCSSSRQTSAKIAFSHQNTKSQRSAIEVPALELEEDICPDPRTSQELQQPSNFLTIFATRIETSELKKSEKSLTEQRLTVENLDSSRPNKAEDTNYPEVDPERFDLARSASRYLDRAPKIDTTGSPKIQTERDQQRPKGGSSSDKDIEDNGPGTSQRKKETTQKNTPREKPLEQERPQNVFKALLTTRNRPSKEQGESSPATKSTSPKSGFERPNILDDILCDEENSTEGSVARGEEKSLSNPTKNRRDGKVDNIVRIPLPLTGDPDIDEEIIAFYKAKQAGGFY